MWHHLEPAVARRWISTDLKQACHISECVVIYEVPVQKLNIIIILLVVDVSLIALSLEN